MAASSSHELELVRALALELYSYPHLSLQSTLKLRLLTPPETQAFEEHFGLGVWLRRGKIDRALQHMRDIVVQDPLMIFTGLGMADMVLQLLISRSSVDIDTAEVALGEAANYGYLVIVEMLLSRFNFYSVDVALAEAAGSGHLEVVTTLLRERVRDPDWAFYQACLGGHFEVAQLLLQAGATKFNKALGAAARGGSIKLVRWLLELGATKVGPALESGVYSSKSNTLEIVELLLSLLPADKAKIYIENAATYAVTPAVVIRLLMAGASNYHAIFEAATRHGDPELLAALLNYRDNAGRPLIPHYYETLANIAAFNGRAAALELLLRYTTVDINKVLLKAADSGNLATVKVALAGGATSFDAALVRVCYSGSFSRDRKDIVVLLCQAGARNFEAALAAANEMENFKAIRYLKGKASSR